jgi:hypothetical protein
MIHRTPNEIEAIRLAQTVCSSAIHPDTKEIIPWAFRMSSFMPMNIPICFGLFIVAPTTFNTVFWQCINQTYNAGLNYANRNASSNYTNQDIMKGYTAAMISSIGVSLVIRRALLPWTTGVKGAKGYVYNSISAFIGCAAAGFLNAWFMRQSEMEKGINVLDPETLESYGSSKKLAHTAVLQTSLSRVALNLTMFLPSLCLLGVEKMRLMPRARAAAVAVEFIFIAGELYIEVPVGIAIYPAMGKIEANKLEPEFHEIRNSRGEIIKDFMFNKGL